MNRYLYDKLQLLYTRDDKTDANAIKGFHNRHAFLSNFYPAEFYMDGVLFCCSEQAFMWLKSDNPIYRRAIMAETRPGRIKKLGKSAVLPADWKESGCYHAMFKVEMAKYSVPQYKGWLLGTGQSYLEETNWHGDVHWGVSATTGKGEDHLGRILMCTRYIKERE